MNKSTVVGVTLAVFGLGGLAFGAWQVQQPPEESGPQYADIVGTERVTRSVETPREVCEDVVVSQAAPQQPSRDPNRIAGTAAGAVVGGLLGNQVGGGSGKTLATVAGVVGGGLAGREVQGRIEANQAPQTYTTTQRQCHTVMDSHQETLGYDVTWRYGDVVQTSRVETSPQGDRVLIEDGRPRWESQITNEG
ncbi:glycine zipper 2TM domain-containing protein [Halomonas sp. M5N1S17]|uniref:glycine zipper 2TM domain-containing protein n=1 Tax=Halomonas alkalisoli TaxID=2907158 RepID=UPI001F459EAD|nr:glycine zipper 2TM domain-containing protein [Halomonas alkalisoli]MCE9664458.1 glycine zipper 2TM domain-containing protein [Halomonas alkalisoli]